MPCGFAVAQLYHKANPAYTAAERGVIKTMSSSHALVMFDVDGTLVESNEIDSLMYRQAIREVLAIEFDGEWERYRNVTDGGILQQVLEENGVSDDPTLWSGTVEEKFCSLLKDEFDRRTERLSEIPGSKVLLERLLTTSDVTVAIATGGWREAARLKLSEAGIELERFVFATGSDAVRRIDIMKIAEERALKGKTVSRRIYFGDGEWDRVACRQLDYEFVAVGGGLDHQPQFTDLAATEHVIERLAL